MVFPCVSSRKAHATKHRMIHCFFHLKKEVRKWQKRPDIRSFQCQSTIRNIFEAHRPFIRSAHVVLEYGEPIYRRICQRNRKIPRCPLSGDHSEYHIQKSVTGIKYDEKSFSDFFLHWGAEKNCSRDLLQNSLIFLPVPISQNIRDTSAHGTGIRPWSFLS